MPNFTTNLNQMDNNLRSCHGPWGQRAKLSPSSAGVNTPRLSINDLLEVVEEGRGLLQSSLSDFRLLKLLCLQKYTLNETLNFCTARGTGSQIIDYILLSDNYIFQTYHAHQKSLNLTCHIRRTNYNQIALSFVIK